MRKLLACNKLSFIVVVGSPYLRFISTFNAKAWRRYTWAKIVGKLVDTLGIP